MGRFHKNIKIQLNRELDKQLRIGEKKEKIYSNPNKADGVHSIGTAQAYRTSLCMFGDYLKAEGVKNLEDITREHVQGFLDSRSDLSPWTLSKDLSAINKVLGTEYAGREMGIPLRRSIDVVNSRGYAQYCTNDKERNAEALRFVAACGIRRASIGTITPSQAVYANGQVIGFSVVEKGGRERLCVVLEPEREWVTQLVKDHIAQPLSPMLTEPDHQANPHALRAQYAQDLYAELKEARDEGRDYYCGMREQFINQEFADKALSRYAHEVYKGYELAVVAEVSQNLGHNRLDVILNHYLR